MKLLVTGANGQLGYDVVKVCGMVNIETSGFGAAEMDVTDEIQVRRKITKEYDGVVHCAAWTSVDKAEKEIKACRNVNFNGTAIIVKVCKELDIPLLYFSTDYVFNGLGERPWQVYDKREPLNVYGMTKYEGELEVEKLEKYFIIRTSWVFGIHGNNFVKTILRLGQKEREINVVNDQVGAPTYTIDLAKICVDIIQTKEYGIYHITNEGDCSWDEFASEILKQNGLAVKVNSVDSSEFQYKARRPLNSRLSKEELDKHGFYRLPSWKDALGRYLKEMSIVGNSSTGI